MKIVSLGIGLAVGLVLIAKVYFEQSYDDFIRIETGSIKSGRNTSKWRGVEGLSANKRWHRSNYATTDTRDRDRHPIHEFWRLDLYDDRHQDEILRSLYHSG